MDVMGVDHGLLDSFCGGSKRTPVLVLAHSHCVVRRGVQLTEARARRKASVTDCAVNDSNKTRTVSSICLRIYFSPVGFKGNLSLLEIFLFFPGA